MNEDDSNFDSNMEYKEIKANEKYGKWNQIYHFERGNYINIVGPLMKRIRNFFDENE